MTTPDRTITPPAAPRLTFSEAIGALADAARLAERRLDPSEVERLRRFADGAVAGLETGPGGTDVQTSWLDRAPCVPAEPDVHVVSRIGMCAGRRGPESVQFQSTGDARLPADRRAVGRI